jgi:hypothetical protein
LDDIVSAVDGQITVRETWTHARAAPSFAIGSPGHG